MITTYAIARNLVGFKSTSLRVKVIRSEGEYVWVMTADLLDAGTNLVLNSGQIEPETAETVLLHESGLVAF